MSSKTLVQLLAVCAFLAAGAGVLFAAPDSVKTAAKEITVNLKYRGLTGAKRESQNIMYLGLHTSDRPETAFTRSLNLSRDKGLYVRQYHPDQPEKEDWMALELDGDRVVALYADLNNDGKLSSNEKVLPCKEKSPIVSGIFFVTPDFRRKTKDGKEQPYRFFLIERTTKMEGNAQRETRHLVGVSCACVWEGRLTIEGTPFHIILYDSNFDGLFSGSGVCADSMNLLSEAEYADRLKHEFLGNVPLSRLVDIDKRFYSVRIETVPGETLSFKAFIKESDIPLGKLILEFEGAQGMKSELDHIKLCGREGDVFFMLAGPDAGHSQLPAGVYQVQYAAIRYGSAESHDWVACILRGPEIGIVAETPSVLKLGKPKLMPGTAIERDQHLHGIDAKTQTVFAKGDDILCFPDIQGQAGEKYGSFTFPGSKKAVDVYMWIIGEEGKEVVSTSLQYGLREYGYSWKTQNVEPGKYTIIMTVETGPLAGKLEGKTEITIQ